MFVDYHDEAKEQEASETSLSKKEIEASGIFSSLQWLTFDFLAHYVTLTHQNAHCYLLQSTNKKAAKKRCGVYCSTEKSLKMSSAVLLLVTGVLKKKTKNFLVPEMRRPLRWGGPKNIFQTWSRSPVAFDWLLLLNLFKGRAVDHPAVSAVCCSCRCCPSMSAAAAGGAERLSGWC